MRKCKVNKDKYRVFIYERRIWTPENYEGDWNRFEVKSGKSLENKMKEIEGRGHEYAVYAFLKTSEANFRSEGTLISIYDAYIEYLP